MDASRDRRERARKRAKIEVTVRADAGELPTRTLDISPTGAFLLCENPLPRNARVELVFSGTLFPRPFFVTGQVVRVARGRDHRGMAIRFLLPPGAVRADLINAIGRALRADQLAAQRQTIRESSSGESFL